MNRKIAEIVLCKKSSGEALRLKQRQQSLDNAASATKTDHAAKGEVSDAHG